MQNEIEKAGQKRAKGEGKAAAARQRVLDKYVNPAGPQKQQFADPALLFS